VTPIQIFPRFFLQRWRERNRHITSFRMDAARDAFERGTPQQNASARGTGGSLLRSAIQRGG